MRDRPGTSPIDPAAPGGAAGAVLAVRGVAKSFPIGDGELEVLHGVDLELGRHERLALVGASGAGKSTLLHVAALLDAPTRGQVLIDGQDGWALPLAERARLRNQKIGFVFQFYHLLPELTALENVLLPAMIAHSRFGFLAKRSELRDRAASLLDDFGLSARVKHRPGQLSGGERQRVALARALFHDPPILIADEPTGNLDTATGARVLDLIFAEQEKRSLSLLLVTHDERLAARCQRSVTMRDGRIVAESAAAPA